MNSIPLWLQLLRSYCLYFPFMRGKWRLVTWAYQNLKIPDAHILSKLDGTICLTLHLNIWVDFNIYCLGLYEYYLANFFKKNINKDMIFLDIGSYIGQYALLAAHNAPQGKIFAFEPNHETAQRLKDNINRNHFSNIEVITKAVGDYDGYSKFYIPQQPFNSSIAAEHAISKNKVMVPITRLDTFYEEQNLTHVDIIKIDVEGAEDSVISGASSLIASTKPMIIIEIGKKSASAGRSEALGFLKTLGYKFFKFERARLLPFMGPLHATIDIIAIPD